MAKEEFKPGTYTVISDDNANIRREPRIISGAVSNIVGSHTPGTQVEVYEVLVDKSLMVWGRVSVANQGTGKANWMCIHTGNRMLLKPMANSNGRILKVMIDDVVVFETNLN